MSKTTAPDVEVYVQGIIEVVDGPGDIAFGYEATSMARVCCLLRNIADAAEVWLATQEGEVEMPVFTFPAKYVATPDGTPWVAIP